MEYNFGDIEKKWQRQWIADGTYKVNLDPSRPKFYVLDMFPYPSGVGLHVGHPLGYIASDVYARFKRLKGFNVLHTMGYDSFGLPAEQYAIEHGIHPAVSTDANISNFRRQLDTIGFCYDWSREFRTSDPSYYKWTQWIFLQLFQSWYDRRRRKAMPIEGLITIFEQDGNTGHPCPGEPSLRFTAAEWKGFDRRRREEILMNYRLAYCGYGEVNWCEALGTVLANDEVINGLSERGGYPVVKKKLRQWYLRITEYADRLLEGLERVDFSDAMKEMQSNWIGKSFGAEITFDIYQQGAPANTRTAGTSGHTGSATSGAIPRLTVYTTRPDTIFGVDFMVVAPEHELIATITSSKQRAAVEEYIAYVNNRSERERMAEKKITGCFTGAYAIHPFTGLHIPIWISEYVLAGYGTGAIMAVPCGDERDFKFARYFDIPITNIIGDNYNGQEANPTKEAVLENSGFLDGIVMKDAILIAIHHLEEKGIGSRKVNYRMRDAAFSRQRYWGEPFPITWSDGIATPLEETELPLELPHVEKYGPGPEGEGPLANVPAWTARHLETNTMP
ncbi:MAG TPA: class I tRNA ligase family protein, partial [Puia sp.]|nr:class I tRNA ligase family protein [Puia sp.]